MKSKMSRVRAYTALALSLALTLVVAAIISCGGSTTSSSSNPTTGTVNTFLSDPPVCSSFVHVYVTVTKVEANISSGAGPNDSGWQTLVDLSSNPETVDLMALNPDRTADFCGTLFKLGSKALPPGKYQQIRLYLMPTNASSGTPPANCTEEHDDTTTSYGWNCVVTGTETAPVYSELQLSSQVQTGIKIPSSQITSGGLTVTAGQSVDFNIDINTCASIVRQGNGRYRLKPVLHAHADEVNANGANTISGKVVEGDGSPNPGMGIPDAIVLLEQPDGGTPTPTDRMILSGRTNPDGTFAFCPVAPTSSSNFDVVVAGTTTQTMSGVTTTTTYNPSVVFGVPIGGSTGSIPLFAEDSSGGPADPATISGEIQTSDASGGVPGDVQLSALQTVTNGGNPVNITIPVLQAGSMPTSQVTDSQPPIYMTIDNTSSSDPTGCAVAGEYDCVTYSVMVPASAVAVGTYDSTSGNDVEQLGSTSEATYTIEGLADGSNGLLMCTTPTDGVATSSAVTVTSGSTVDETAESSLVLAFSGCTEAAP